VFGKKLADTNVYSDSISMYVLVLLLFLFALLSTVTLQAFKFWRRSHDVFLEAGKMMLCYFLSLHVLKYGVDKLSKHQFYLPEPNTLFTAVGELDKDILFWTSMGSSYGYNIATGILEIVAALLLLHARSRIGGLVLSALLLLHIVVLNFSFDISVKLFSLLLLAMNIFLLLPFMRRILCFFSGGPTPSRALAWQRIGSSTPKQVFFHSLIAGLIIIEAIYPCIRDNRFNDDLALRPPLHGAYDVTGVIVGKDTIVSATVTRFFIHRRGYIIFQDKDGNMMDYRVRVNPGLHEMILTNHRSEIMRLACQYMPADSLLIVQSPSTANSQLRLVGKAINWKVLPLMQDDFNWVSDNPGDYQ
jgi:hypothetical protein